MVGSRNIREVKKAILSLHLENFFENIFLNKDFRVVGNSNKDLRT